MASSAPLRPPAPSSEIRSPRKPMRTLSADRQPMPATSTRPMKPTAADRSGVLENMRSMCRMFLPGTMGPRLACRPVSDRRRFSGDAARASERDHPLALDRCIDHLALARTLARMRGQRRALEVFLLGLAATAGAQHLDRVGAGGDGDE